MEGVWQDRTLHQMARFTPEHLDGVLRLCVAEGWPSFPQDPERAARALTAPGVTTVVALDEQTVVGFAQLFSDGEIQAFLALIAVDSTFRGSGTGRALVTEALRLGGGERVDLLGEDENGTVRAYVLVRTSTEVPTSRAQYCERISGAGRSMVAQSFTARSRGDYSAGRQR